MAPAAHPVEQLGLGRRDALERAELLEVDRADVRDDADVGLADRGQLGDLARSRASPARAPAPRCPNGAASTSSGSPISVLKFSREAATLRCGAIIAAIRSLVEVLPTEPVTAITCAARSCRQARASAPSAGTGVSEAITAPVVALVGQQLVDPVRLDHDAPRAGLERGGGERAAVDLLAREAEEEVAGRDGARVDHRARRAARRAAAGGLAHELRAGRARHALGAPVLHARSSHLRLAAPRARP